MSTIYLTSKSKGVAPYYAETMVVISEGSDAPEVFAYASGNTSIFIPDAREQIEIDLGGGFHLDAQKGSTSINVYPSPLSDNFAEADLVMVVTGDTTDGLRLQISGAFEDMQKGVFFWG